MADEERKAITLNLRDVTSGFEPIPEGRYLLEVVSGTIPDGKNSQKPYLNLQMKVVDEDYENRRLWFTGSLDAENKDAMSITVENLENLTGLEIAGNADYSLNCDELVSLQCYGIVEIEETDEYGIKNVIKGLKPLTGEMAEIQAAKMQEEGLW